MYADTISESMQTAMDETLRRREVQMKYNDEHNIIPKTIIKEIPKTVSMKRVEEISNTSKTYHKNMTKEERELTILALEEEMRSYAKELNFEAAAEYRDKLKELKITLRDYDV